MFATHKREIKVMTAPAAIATQAGDIINTAQVLTLFAVGEQQYYTEI